MYVSVIQFFICFVNFTVISGTIAKISQIYLREYFTLAHPVCANMQKTVEQIFEILILIFRRIF